MIEVRSRGVAGRVARVDAHRGIEVLIVEQREERDADRGVGDLDAVDRRARRRVSRVLDVADDDARLDIVWRGAIDDDLGAAEIDEVVRRDDRHARPFQAHLDVVAGGRLERAHAAQHRPARGHDDAGGAGLEIRDGRLADLVRDANLVGPVLSDLRLPRFLQAEERRLLAVLLEGDTNRLQRLGVRRVDRDLERARRADELLGLFDGDGRGSHAPRDDPGAAGGKEEDKDEADEILHRVIIVGTRGSQGFRGFIRFRRYTRFRGSGRMSRLC